MIVFSMICNDLIETNPPDAMMLWASRPSTVLLASSLRNRSPVEM